MNCSYFSHWENQSYQMHILKIIHFKYIRIPPQRVHLTWDSLNWWSLIRIKKTLRQIVSSLEWERSNSLISRNLKGKNQTDLVSWIQMNKHIYFEIWKVIYFPFFLLKVHLGGCLEAQIPVDFRPRIDVRWVKFDDEETSCSYNHC